MARFRSKKAIAGAIGLTAGASALLVSTGSSATFAVPPSSATATPVKHLVVIFQENVSFDHYFGTYPNATNADGQSFTPVANTPTVNGLTPELLTSNPNGVNPRRYDPTQVSDVLTCDQDHNYADEQKAFDGGKMDMFPQTVGTGSSTKSPENQPCNANDVMNYYDGNTVTAMWNYAQHYAMSDNSFGTTFGPSAPGAINLVSGDTGAVDTSHLAKISLTPCTSSKSGSCVASAANPNADIVADGKGGYSLISDAQPYWDDCSTRDAAAMSGQNIGDLLNAKGLSWGWFQGGFRPTTTFATATSAVKPGQSTAQFTPDEFSGAFTGKNVPAHASNQALCDAVHPVGIGLPASLGTGNGQYGYKDDYIPHHEPFQYDATTANPHHLTVPSDTSGQDTTGGLESIGKDTQSYKNGQPQFNTPNHNYDTSDFDQLVAAIHNGDVPPSALPAVSFLKAPGFEDGHAAYSDPLDEQRFVVNEINALQRTPDWKDTAVVIAYDDSDGWYDHAYPGVTNPSATVSDFLTGTGTCGSEASQTPLAGEQGRCGYGPRLPLLVVSPWSAPNHVDSTLTSQTSITKFVEDNWGLGGISGSFDAVTGSLDGLFDFNAGPGRGQAFGRARDAGSYQLDPNTGQPLG